MGYANAIAVVLLGDRGRRSAGCSSRRAGGHDAPLPPRQHRALRRRLAVEPLRAACRVTWMLFAAFKTQARDLHRSARPARHAELRQLRARLEGRARPVHAELRHRHGAVGRPDRASISGMAAYVLSRSESRWLQVVYLLHRRGLRGADDRRAGAALPDALRRPASSTAASASSLPYAAYGIPFTTILFYAFFLDFPRELEEAARLDGCGRMQIFFRIIVPLSGPAVASAAIFQAVFIWNEFLLALLMLTRPALKTLPVGILQLQGEFTSDWPAVMAGPRHRDRADPRRLHASRRNTSSGRWPGWASRSDRMPSLVDRQRRQGLWRLPRHQGREPRGRSRASSSSWSAPPAAASPRCCGPSPGWKAITSGSVAHQRPRRHARRTGEPRRRHGVPELRALPAHDACARTWASRSRSPGRPRAEIEAAVAARRRDPAHHRASRQAARSSFPAARSSASPSAAPSPVRPKSSCSTSRCPTSTRRCARRCGSSSAGCTPSSRRRWSTSPTTRPRP